MGATHLSASFGGIECAVRPNRPRMRRGNRLIAEKAIAERMYRELSPK